MAVSFRVKMYAAKGKQLYHGRLFSGAALYNRNWLRALSVLLVPRYSVFISCTRIGKIPSLPQGTIARTKCGDMESGGVIHIGRTNFRNDDRLFGIKHEDRFSHLYIIGKTGTGKSTLIETMALQDLERGNGFALIDPHGDLVGRIAAFRHLSICVKSCANRLGTKQAALSD
jgi:Type IV secretion-system coupling protein DNA-binding domain